MSLTGGNCLVYDAYTITCQLQRVVPEDIGEVTHAFESIGHIAHLNLRDGLLPYKHIIGQVRWQYHTVSQ